MPLIRPTSIQPTKPFGKRAPPPPPRWPSEEELRLAAAAAAQARAQAELEARWERQAAQFQATLLEAQRAVAKRRLQNLGAASLNVAASFLIGLKLGA